MCAKQSKNAFKFVKVIHGKLQVLFPDTVYVVIVDVGLVKTPKTVFGALLQRAR